MLSSMDPLPHPVLNAMYWILLLVSNEEPPFHAKPHQGSLEQRNFLQANYLQEYINRLWNLLIYTQPLFYDWLALHFTALCTLCSVISQIRLLQINVRHYVFLHSAMPRNDCLGITLSIVSTVHLISVLWEKKQWLKRQTTVFH